MYTLCKNKKYTHTNTVREKKKKYKTIPISSYTNQKK